MDEGSLTVATWYIQTTLYQGKVEGKGNIITLGFQTLVLPHLKTEQKGFYSVCQNEDTLGILNWPVSNEQTTQFKL